MRDNKKHNLAYKDRTDLINGLSKLLIITYGYKHANKMANKIANICEYNAEQEHKVLMKRENINKKTRLCYIRGLLVTRTKLKSKDIPQELAEVKKLQLSIERFLKGQNNEKM